MVVYVADITQKYKLLKKNNWNEAEKVDFCILNIHLKKYFMFNKLC